jgi:hypothetical protein
LRRAEHRYAIPLFHRRDEIGELWRVKHDRRLAVAQIVHSALPGIMAINNLWRQSPAALTRHSPIRPRDVILVPTPVALSPVAAHFLERLRSLAAARGGRVRIVSVPLPDTEPWADASRVFDDGIMYLPRETFGDGVHLGPIGMKSCAGTEIARRFAAAHGLTADLPVAQVPADQRCGKD